MEQPNETTHDASSNVNNNYYTDAIVTINYYMVQLREKGQQEASIVYHYLAAVPDSSQLTTNIRYSLVEVNKQ